MAVASALGVLLCVRAWVRVGDILVILGDGWCWMDGWMDADEQTTEEKQNPWHGLRRLLPGGIISVVVGPTKEEVSELWRCLPSSSSSCVKVMN